MQRAECCAMILGLAVLLSVMYLDQYLLSL